MVRTVAPLVCKIPLGKSLTTFLKFTKVKMLHKVNKTHLAMTTRVMLNKFWTSTDAFRRLSPRLTLQKWPGLTGLKLHTESSFLPQPCSFLLTFFINHFCQQRVPMHWLNCKMTCIPKKQGKTTVKDLRPLTISPVCYRLFCKTVLVMHANTQQNIPEHSVGGVIGRAAFHA